MPALDRAKGRPTWPLTAWTPVPLAFMAAAVVLVASGGIAAAAAIAFDRPDLQAPAPLQVTVPGVASGGTLAANYAFDGRNLSPPVSWSEGPPQTRSYVVLMQDADAASPGAGPAGVVHWLVYAIPPKALALPRGMRNVASPSNPLGSSQGRNTHDSLGYSGPHPLVGEPAHHYHLQVFALDRPLRLRPGADAPVVLNAMAGHVIARGELVATYVAPSPDAPHGRQKGTAPAEPAPPAAAPTAPRL